MTLTSPPETRFEDRLRLELLAAYADQFGDGVGTTPTTRHPRTAIRVGVAVAVAAGLSGIALASTGTFTTHGRGRTNVATPPATRHVASHRGAVPPTKATLVAAVVQAVANVEGDIFHVHTVSGSGMTTDDWLSGDGNQFRSTTSNSSGEYEDLTQQTSAGTVVTTVVDYPHRAWWTYSEPAQPTPTTGAPGKGEPPLPDINGVPGTAAGVQWLLASGNYIVVPGTQTVHGVSTYEMSRTFNGNTFALWIDQATDLPVQVQMSNSSDPSAGFTSTAQWIDPTTQSLANLQAPIPADFTHSAQPISSAPPTGGGVR